MFIVRINHKNGFYAEFLFLDMGKANAFARDCAAAKEAGAMCHLFDEAGRETWLDGAEILVVQYADLVAEIQMNTRLKVVVEMTARDWMQQMGLSEQQPVQVARPAGPPADVVPIRQPAIGTAQFAT